MNESPHHRKQIALPQTSTIVWMFVEVAVSAYGAARAHSVALAGFGGDSAIELVSASVVLLRFKNVRGINEHRATQITAWLLFALAAFIVGSSILVVANPKFHPATKLVRYRFVGRGRNSDALAGPPETHACC